MEPVPLTTEKQHGAVDHAIRVHLDYFKDIGEEENYEILSTALDTMEEKNEIPADAVKLVWHILYELGHIYEGIDLRYNEGTDAEPLTRVGYNITIINGDEIHAVYNQ